MAATIQKKHEAAGNDSFTARAPSIESPDTGSTNASPLEQTSPSDRKLRNRLIIANAVAWIVIIVAIRWIFF